MKARLVWLLIALLNDRSKPDFGMHLFLLRNFFRLGKALIFALVWPIAG